MQPPPDPGPPKHVGLSNRVVSGPAGPLARVWTAKCDSPTDFSSIASVNPGIGCVRVGGATTVHLRGPEMKASTDSRILLDGRVWEMPTPQNVDVFIDRLKRAGLLVFDPLVEELEHGGATGTVPERHAARLLRAGAAITDVVSDAGYYDQPHLTRALRQLIGHTPAELVRGGMFLDL